MRSHISGAFLWEKKKEKKGGGEGGGGCLLVGNEHSMAEYCRMEKGCFHWNDNLVKHIIKLYNVLRDIA